MSIDSGQKRAAFSSGGMCHFPATPAVGPFDQGALASASERPPASDDCALAHPTAHLCTRFIAHRAVARRWKSAHRFGLQVDPPARRQVGFETRPYENLALPAHKLPQTDLLRPISLLTKFRAALRRLGRGEDAGAPDQERLRPAARPCGASRRFSSLRNNRK
jgi:hypothetical protein